MEVYGEVGVGSLPIGNSFILGTSEYVILDKIDGCVFAMKIYPLCMRVNGGYNYPTSDLFKYLNSQFLEDYRIPSPSITARELDLSTYFEETCNDECMCNVAPLSVWEYNEYGMIIKGFDKREKSIGTIDEYTITPYDVVKGEYITCLCNGEIDGVPDGSVFLVRPAFFLKEWVLVQEYRMESEIATHLYPTYYNYKGKWFSTCEKCGFFNFSESNYCAGCGRKVIR